MDDRQNKLLEAVIDKMNELDISKAALVREMNRSYPLPITYDSTLSLAINKRRSVSLDYIARMMDAIARIAGEPFDTRCTILDRFNRL